MQTVEHQVEISAEMERVLELLRQSMRLPSTTAVLERLISAQLDSSVYEMTGIKPGPRLAIDNTTAERDEREGHTTCQHTPAPGP